MSDRSWGAALISAGVVLAAGACGHPEKSVVDNYFRAVNAEDNQTLASFAAVNFDQKVDSWSIKETVSEERRPASLPELAGRVDEIQAKLDENKKKYNAYFLDHPQEVDQVRELLKTDSKIPSKLEQYAEDWKGFIETEKDLKKQLAEAKDAVSKEKRNVALSMGQVDNAESVVGEMVEKRVRLELVVKGAAQEYVMTLRRYEPKVDAEGPRVVSRWMVFELRPA